MSNELPPQWPSRSDFAAPTPAELEIIASEMHLAGHGQILQRKAAQGIADMQARIDLLTGQRQLVADQLAQTTDDRIGTLLDQQLTAIQGELAEAQTRLREYQLHQSRLN